MQGRKKAALPCLALLLGLAAAGLSFLAYVKRIKCVHDVLSATGNPQFHLIRLVEFEDELEKDMLSWNDDRRRCVFNLRMEETNWVFNLRMEE
ncbi:hypothetical protein KSS87_003791 [Heliosperma pusillum]|nr:hypothetical protein KSS87_003791 [Heliosperma pusillum]